MTGRRSGSHGSPSRGIRCSFSRPRDSVTARPHRTRIDEDGFCVLEGVIPAGAVGGERGQRPGHGRGPQDRRSAQPPRQGVRPDQLRPVLRPPTSPSLACWAGPPGGARAGVVQPPCMVRERGSWHADWPFNQQKAGHVQAPCADANLHLRTIWMLTPFTADTGTLVVPGSHRLGYNPSGDAGPGGCRRT